MNIEKIKTIFNEKREVHFKLYSLDYTIKEVDGKMLVYADLYDNKKDGLFCAWIGKKNAL